MRLYTNTLDAFPPSGFLQESIKENTEIQRSGAACGQCDTGVKSVLTQSLDPTLGRAYYYRFAFRLSELPASTKALLAADDSTGRVFELSVSSDGHVTMWCPIAGAHPAEGEFYLDLDRSEIFTLWAVIEVFWRVNEAGEGEIAWKANGEYIAFPQSIALRNTGVSVLYTGAVNSTSATIYIDDVTLNDETGSADNTWVGTEGIATPTVPGCMWGALAAGGHYDPEWEKAPYDERTWDEFEANAGRKMGIIHHGDPWLTFDGFGAGSSQAAYERGETTMKSIGDTGSEDPLGDVLAGDHDEAIEAWAAAAAAYGRRLLLRPWWEMNGDWFPWGRAANYVAAWRHLYDLIKPLAPKVEFVWCTNTIWEDPESDPEPYYPGDEYVDWVGFDAYTGQNPAKPLGWKDPTTLYLPTYARLREIAPSKGIIVCETACSEIGGDKAGWIADLLGNVVPHTCPEIKGLVWFNWEIEEGEPAGSMLDWPIESSEAAQEAFAEQIAATYYQPAPPTVATRPAAEVYLGKAMLTGTVNPNGLATQYWFEFWREGSSPSFVPASKAGDSGEGNLAVATSELVESLDANVHYHFRLHASNELGESTGAEATFKSAGFSFPRLRSHAQLRVVAIAEGGTGQGYELTDQIEGLSWSSINPGGDERCNFTLVRSWVSSSPEIARGNLLRVMNGIDVLWQGRVEETDRSADSTEKITVTAYGLGNRLKDGTFQEIFIDRDLANWTEPTKAIIKTRLESNHTNFTGQVHIDAAKPILRLSVVEGWPDGARCALLYTSADVPIGIVRASRERISGENFAYQIALRKDDSLAETLEKNTGLIAEPSDHELVQSAPGVEARYAEIMLYNDQEQTQGGKETADSWFDIRIFGAHGLVPKIAVPGTAPSEGFSVDQMIRFIVGLVDGIRTRRIDAQSYIVRQAAFKEPTPHEEGISELNKLEACDWGTWGPESPLDTSTDGQFDFTDREPETRHWFVRREDCGEDLDLHSETSTLYGAVDVTFEDVAGVRRTVRRTVDVPDLDGVGFADRVYPLDIGKSTLEVAEQMGDAFLAIWGQFAPARGSFSTNLPVHHHERGELPPVYLRADGSNVEIGGILPSTSALALDSSPDRRTIFPIKRVEIDASAETATARVEIDQAGDSLSVLQARQGLETRLAVG